MQEGGTEACNKVEVTPETALQKGSFQKASGKQEEGESLKLSSLGAFIFLLLYLAKSRFQPIFATQIYLFICTAKSV